MPSTEAGAASLSHAALHNAGGAVGPAIAALFVSEHDHGSVIWLVSVSVMASLGCFMIAKRSAIDEVNALRVPQRSR